MKLYNMKSLKIVCLVGACMLGTSCVELDQYPTGEVASDLFWKTEADAEYALNAVYMQARRQFNRDYVFDGNTEYYLFTGNVSTSQASGDISLAYRGGKYDNPSSAYGGNFDTYYQQSYSTINFANYTVDNIEKMLPNVKSEASKKKLQAFIGEARMLRAMAYFRLISMWGDVPYFDKTINDNSEVEFITRTPIAEIYQHLYDDFTYAWENLPDKPVALGRMDKWGALAFRGKLQLYWACWNRIDWPWNSSIAPNGGWPELTTFAADPAASAKAYKDAAADFRKVIEESGITLFRNGEPGDWGKMGECEVLPNYYYLFTPDANEDRELMVGFAHGGVGTGQGEELMRDNGTRSTENSQMWGQPRMEIVNRYQSTITGDFCEPIVGMNPNAPDARTAKNSALNPETYKDRDYRMKATILWEDETQVGLMSRTFDQIRKYRYKVRTGSIDGFGAINADRDNTGYIMRKFVRNKPGLARNEGNYKTTVLRLADVYLMYAEAANEAYGPLGDGGLALEVVNKIRHRGNLPALAAEKYANKETFFYAIEQERIVELYAEGHRFFDLRRWRSIERVFVGPETSPGVKMYDSHGSERYHYFNNTSYENYHRQYIFRIPPSERNKNPNLTQNECWL